MIKIIASHLQLCLVCVKLTQVTEQCYTQYIYATASDQLVSVWYLQKLLDLSQDSDLVCCADNVCFYI